MSENTLMEINIPDPPLSFSPSGRPPVGWLKHPTMREMIQYIQVMNERHRLVYKMYLDLLKSVEKGNAKQIAKHANFASEGLSEFAPDEFP